jgi:hypothetical protein
MSDGHLHDLAESMRRASAAPTARASQAAPAATFRRCLVLAVDGRLARIGLVAADGSTSQEIDGCAIWGSVPDVGARAAAVFEGERPVPFVVAPRAGGRPSVVAFAIGRMSGFPPPDPGTVFGLSATGISPPLGPFTRSWRSAKDGMQVPRNTLFETSAGTWYPMVGLAAGVRARDVDGLRTGDTRIIHDTMTAAVFPITEVTSLGNFVPPGEEELEGAYGPMTVRVMAGDVLRLSHTLDDGGFGGGTGGLLYPSSEQVFSRDGYAYTWGTPMGFWSRWHPRLGHTAYVRDFIDDSGAGSFGRPGFELRERTADAGRDYSQVPFGGQQYVDELALTVQDADTGEYVPYVLWDGDYTEKFSEPTYPVWICSSLVRPLSLGLDPPLVLYSHGGWDVGAGENQTGVGVGKIEPFDPMSRLGSDAPTDWFPLLTGVSLWWYDPAHAYNHWPHVVWGNWATALEYERVTAPYWMGCGNYNPYVPYKGTGDARTVFPTNLEGVWAPAAGWAGDPVARRGVTLQFGNRYFDEQDAGLLIWNPDVEMYFPGGAITDFGEGAEMGQLPEDLAPGIKIDGGCQLPGFEFARPARLLALVLAHGAENVRVVSSTAEVRVSGARRLEYWLEVYNRQVSSNTDSWSFLFLENGTYGPRLRQRDADGEWRTIYQARWLQRETSGGARTDEDGLLEGNTHLPLALWKKMVQEATGTNPGYTSTQVGEGWHAPGWVPKLPPWVAAGDPNAPASVTPPSGWKGAHFLIGLQPMGAISGEGAEDTACRPTLAMFHDYRAWGFNYSDFPEAMREEYDDAQLGTYDEPPPGTSDYDYPWLQPPTDDAMMEWVRGQKDYVIGGLENTAHRALQFSPVSRRRIPLLESLTRVGTTATVTCATPHGLVVGSPFGIYGAHGGDAWNGEFEVSEVVSATVFKYTMSGTPGSGAADGDFVLRISGYSDDNVVPNDAWTECNMVDVAEELVRDVAPRTVKQTWWTEENPETFVAEHRRYRIVPGQPWTHGEKLSRFDGLQRNISMLANSFLPASIEDGAFKVDPGSDIFQRWTFVLFDIMFQEMQSWELRNWQTVVEYPDGAGGWTQETIRIATPWD